MTVGPTTLAVIVWGSVLLVALLFAYLVALVVQEIRDRRASEPRG